MLQTLRGAILVNRIQQEVWKLIESRTEDLLEVLLKETVARVLARKKGLQANDTPDRFRSLLDLVGKKQDACSKKTVRKEGIKTAIA